ncbi:MAG: signal peptidase I [Arenicella sp.]|jgi:signal peptidase I
MSTTTDSVKNKKNAKKKKGVLREWVDSIVFAVVAATLIRWLFIEAYMIPTPSMENSLLVGDYLFVSKMHYGARTPATPLQVPLTFQKIWGTDIPSYLEWMQLPMYRLPGFSEVKRYDPVVFNYPADGTGEFDNADYSNTLGIPPDMRTYYIKRCVGLPGDKFEVRDQEIVVDGKVIESPEGMQVTYLMNTTQVPSTDRVFYPNNITEFNLVNGNNIPDSTLRAKASGEYTYVITASEKNVEALRKLDFVNFVEKFKREVPSGDVFDINKDKNWTADDFGPISIPKEGMKVTLDKENVATYRVPILHYEGNDDAKFENGKIYIDGKEITEYTFKNNYYFMMGDNRHNSLDSRFWGFVPEEYVVGKALFIWWSVNPNATWSEFSDKVRWNRVFSLID